MDKFFANMIELKIDSPMHKYLTHNDCEYIEDIFTNNDEDISDLFYSTDAGEFKSLSKVHYNIMNIFVAYF